MPRYIISRSYGLAGDQESEEIEAENQTEADEMAWEFALERVNGWAELVSDDEEETDE